MKKSKNRVKFRIKGLNQEKFLNNISQVATIYNYKRLNHQTGEFETDFSKEKFVKKAVIEQGLEIEVLSRYGFLSLLKNLVTSYGVMIAVVLSSLFYSLQYQFIWKIEIYGEEKVLERELKTFVQENLQTKSKSKIDTKNLEMKVKENFKQISSLSVAIVGQSLVINIYEAVLPEEMEGEYQPLVSEYDGLVKEINLIQGTLAVNEGQLIKKGDVLVYPYIIDSQGEERAVEPKAEIMADVWFQGKEVHYDYKIITRRTGKTETKREVFLNDLLIYSNNLQTRFEDFEVEEKKNPLTYNLILPFHLKTTTFYQIEYVEIKEEFYAVKDKIIASAREKVLIFLQENEIIKEENYTIREEGGCHEVCFVMTVYRNIGG